MDGRQTKHLFISRVVAGAIAISALEACASHNENVAQQASRLSADCPDDCPAPDAPQCWGDGDCASGSVCDTSAHCCVAPPPSCATPGAMACAAATDCAPGESCTANCCIAPSCEGRISGKTLYDPTCGSLVGTSPLGGVTVALDGHDRDGTLVRRTTVSDGQGNYVFDHVAPSDDAGYVLSRIVPPGVRASNKPISIGTLGGSAAGSIAMTLTVPACFDVAPEYDFFFGPAGKRCLIGR